MNKPKILFAVSEEHVRRFFGFALKHYGRYDVTEATDGLAAMQLFAMDAPDLVIIGDYLRKIDGYELCREMRRSWSGPIVFLSGGAVAEAEGLAHGADYYIDQVMGPRDLLPTLENLLTKNPTDGLWATTCMVNGSEVQLSIPGLSRDGKWIGLTVMEARLLHYLMTHCGRVIPISEAYPLWQYPKGQGSRIVVDKHIQRLREKFGDRPTRPTLFPWDQGGYLCNLTIEPQAPAVH